MIPAASQVSSAEMVAHYEHLRGTVLDPLNRLATLPGLALFLRQVFSDIHDRSLSRETEVSC